MAFSFFKHSFMRKFVSDERGVIAMMFALALPVMVTGGGVAFDQGRVQMIERKMHTAADRGLTAAANMPKGTTSAAMERQARKYFGLNFPADYLGSGVSAQNISVEFYPNEIIPQSMTLSYNGTVGTTFMGMLGINTLETSFSHDIALKNRTAQDSTRHVVILLDQSEILAGYEDDVVSGVHAFAEKLSRESLYKTSLSFVRYGTDVDDVVVRIPSKDVEGIDDALDDYDAEASQINGVDTAMVGAALALFGQDGQSPRSDLEHVVLVTSGPLGEPAKTRAQNFQQSCALLAARGVNFYIVDFSAGQASDVYLDCRDTASGSYYLSAPDVNALEQSFRTVAGRISNVGIAQ